MQWIDLSMGKIQSKYFYILSIYQPFSYQVSTPPPPQLQQPFSLPSWNHNTPTQITTVTSAQNRLAGIRPTGGRQSITLQQPPVLNDGHLDNLIAGNDRVMSNNDVEEKPEVDESGYATLILKDEPYYEVPPCHR